MYRAGKYEEAVEVARERVDGGTRIQGWHRLLIESLRAVGSYEEAATISVALIEQRAADVRTLMTAYEAAMATGRAEAGELALRRLNDLVARRGGFWEPVELVTLGRAALKMGGEPRLVLEAFFDAALTADADCREAYLAIADLAIEKQDWALAAEKLQAGLERFGDDPAFHYLLAMAMRESDREAMGVSLDAAVHLNERHVPSWLMRADLAIDAEQYEMADEALGRVLAVDGVNPAAWSLRAVLAHLRSDAAGEEEAYRKALETWATNPAVDHLIGLKLSAKYRFAEAAERQKRALEFDPSHLGARMALGQDLLRLGMDREGWRLIEEVYKADQYQVTAYNLVSLMDRMSQFQEIRTERFVLRMAKRDAELYGSEALGLLNEAWDVLTERYGLELRGPIVVEMYPNQQDFAVRTFGVPGGFGYLGVCFGRVVTANAPGYPGASDANWKAVLWHEFAHVVTLGVTNNKMPRWFSEGISVYEEMQRERSWGQRMTAEYRAMLEEDGVTPIGELSGMFLNPKTPGHVMLAYYQSGLAIEFIVERHGVEALRGILRDMGAGVETNLAIERNTSAMEELNTGYEEFVRERMASMGPDANWEMPEGIEDVDEEMVAKHLADHPNSVWALERQGTMLMEAGRYEEAAAVLERLLTLVPEYAENDSHYYLLAGAYKGLGQSEKEAAVLERLAAGSSRAMTAYRRLIEVGEEQGNWEMAAANAERMLGVNPLEAVTYEKLGKATEESGRLERAAWAYERVLMLEPVDPAGSHYRLARLLTASDRGAARRHVLLALAEAPRFREAHQLLLELTTSPQEVSDDGNVNGAVDDAPPSTPPGDAAPTPAPIAPPATVERQPVPIP